MTQAASSAARGRPPGGARSTIIAVATPVKIPADRPDSSRPANSAGRLSGTRKTAELAAASPSPGSRTALRPIRSDSAPNSSSAASTPTA